MRYFSFVFYVCGLLNRFYLNLCISPVNGHCPYAIELECDALKSYHLNYMNTFFGFGITLLNEF